jgi:adenylate cyclase
VWQRRSREHARAGAAPVGGNAARAAGASAGARVTNPWNANFDDLLNCQPFETEATADEKMKSGNFFAELKRRNVYKVAVAYAVVAWLLVQVATQVFPFFEIPNWAVRLVVLAIVIGFPIALVIAWAFELTPEGIKRTEDVDLAAVAQRPRHRAWIIVIIIAGAMSLGLFFLGRITAPSKQSGANEVSSKSIAVLPFVNMSADKNDEYLSDGMTEELINVLSKVPGLRVPGRTSCFAFKGKNEEDIFRKVGDQLHVGTVLEGSVRKAGDKLRVTAQLINVSDGYHLWSKDYDGDVKDILNFQSNVAEQVVQALQVKLGGEGTRVLAKKPTENPEAHRLYLLGRYEFAKYTQTGWNNAIRYYEQALRIDPEFALAYCGLADNYAYMGSVVMPEKEAIAKEKEFAQKALELDPELAEAHMSLALALVAAYDWRNGLKEFDRALELNPNLAFAYELQSWTLNGLGRFDEAIAKTRKAVELDPLNPFFQMSLSFFQYWARQYDDAIAQARKALAMDPNSAINHVLIGLSFLKKGDTAGAITELQKSKTPDPGAWYQGFLGYAYAISGERAKAEEALRELEELAKRQYVSPTAFATIYLGLGQKEKCLDWLEKSYEQQDSACWYLKIDQIYDSVRNEPRFQALVQKVFHETQ